ncbi:MAG TPA: vitamin B12-dependent ribonucleotide reductase [Candidatus Dormibacteraeota bacterium]|nr:vitamin B12-dependent ribonucleotide reductase [Candidatus Dormibacteraeota bacterium]
MEKGRKAAAGEAVAGLGLKFERRFTKPGVHPFDTVEWDLRTAAITNEKGEVVFEQKDVEVPKSWTQMATNVVVSKYFRGQMGSPARERSVKQLIGRVVDTIHGWGASQGYFADADSAEAFRHELAYLLVTQRMAFNSPVWFNVGVEKKPQGSACFINSIEDTMESILGLAKTEGMLFKYGSGAGVNLSALRGSKERLKHGGTASGPVSFMKGFDAFAGAIKSGGATRRAAKMVILNVDHPDIEEFINCKVNEEKKAWALIDAGYDGSYTGEAYGSVFFQNSNNSVRVPDEFMEAVLKDGSWTTHNIVDGKPAGTFRARELMRSISDAAWVCGDPGLQYDTIIQDWNCVANTARINATNPCSEFVFIDDTACNLASINLMKFLGDDGRFMTEDFKHAVRVTITAQEMIVPNASYPTPRIEENSHQLRPLGLGYANLGALLMALGLPYDSDEGRAYGGSITSLMTGEAYAQSARIAERCGGPFELFDANREPMLRVMNKHRDASYAIDRKLGAPDVIDAACAAWDDAVALGVKHGYRNAQATVLAPTGTIAFMMDCDTTGVEPDIALVKYKKLVGGGLLKIVNNTVPRALRKLGYDERQVTAITDFIAQHDTIEGAPELLPEHLAVFDCAFKAQKGERSIHYMGHLKMVAAVQPFVSGSISKTINLPELASVDDIEQAYIDGWKMGLKCISVYRDNCKRSQPLNTSMDDRKDAGVLGGLVDLSRQPVRRKLPDERASITHKFDIQGHEGYITVGLFEDGTPGEMFLKMAKEGSTISGIMDSFAIMVSIALQYGVPLETLVSKFSHVRFEPSGYTSNQEIPIAKSVVDYIFRWLASKFYDDEAKDAIGIIRREPKPAPAAAAAPAKPAEVAKPKPAAAKPSQASGSDSADELKVVAGVGGVNTKVTVNLTDSMTCSDCGAIMVRAGACYKCLNCGSTSGCG